MKNRIRHDIDSHAIPYKYVQEAINFMEYASTTRVMFQMLVITGCRIKELNSMKISNLYEEGWFYWTLGKNQKGTRKIKLPEFFIKELLEYRSTHRVPQERLFGVRDCTFTRYFNRDVRPHLSKAWREVRIRNRQTSLDKTEYIFQLKGLRKNFQTVLFKKEYDKWNDANVAVLMTSKEMKHSSTHITAYHYIENFESLEIENYKEICTTKIIQECGQMRVFDFN